MPRVDLINECPVNRTIRVQQVEGMFDLTPAKVSQFALTAELPIEENDWQIGLIVGPSGSGKSTLARNLWPNAVITDYQWPVNKAIVDGFPATLGVKDVTGLLSSVGLSSPPAWLKPYRCLSNGEQFRVNLARALAETPVGGVTVFDEFTSLVDRTVAKVSSAAAAKAVRRRQGRQFVAVTCHHDVTEWLQPDWVYQCASGTFTRRLLQRRPAIQLEIVKSDKKAWKLFSRHHYLNTSLATFCHCFVGLVDGEPATFTAAVPFPHPKRPGWREHRTVCLPDYQGVGLGNAMSEYIAGVFRATFLPYRSVTSHPAMIAHRMKSPLWKAIRAPGIVGQVLVSSGMKSFGANSNTTLNRFAKSSSVRRITASFEYVGPARFEAMTGFGLEKYLKKQRLDFPTNPRTGSHGMKFPLRGTSGVPVRWNIKSNRRKKVK